jgi:hypothetical protein
VRQEGANGSEGAFARIVLTSEQWAAVVADIQAAQEQQS